MTPSGRLSFFCRPVLLLVLGLLLAGKPAGACTSAIFSGKHTPSGRPLLWKHRDTGKEYGKVVYRVGERYAFLGIADAGDPAPAVWAGLNSAGLALMNTASYNLKDDEVPQEAMDKEGLLMYRALGLCATLQDFEHFLDTLPRPLGVEANFGVIDGEGGAAYYEVNNHSVKKYDVNDPKTAPEGYLIYTNFSFSGNDQSGLGYERYHTATQLMARLPFTERTPRGLIKGLSRSYAHALLGIDLKDHIGEIDWFVDQDFIPRKSTHSSIVVEGVNPGQDPLQATMWTVLGYPPLGFCLPLWVAKGPHQPQEMTGGKGTDGPRQDAAPLSLWATDLKHRVFPLTRSNGPKYFRFGLLYNAQGSGLAQRVQAAEDSLYAAWSHFFKENEPAGESKSAYKLENCAEFYQKAAEVMKRIYGTR